MDTVKYKICTSCNAKNDTSEAFCTECFGTQFQYEEVESNENIEITNHSKNQIAESDRTIIESQVRKLILTAENFELSIGDNDILGRNGKFANYFKEYNKVSREHIRVYLEQNIWYIEDLNSTNGTYINNQKLNNGSKTRISNGDILKLSSTMMLSVKIS